MILHFYKYQATGNDFVVIDENENVLPYNTELIKFLCDRHFGIGADGLIILRNNNDYDFEMKFFNSDGLPASFCGNGSRCIVAYAYKKKYIRNTCKFLAFDGLHEALVLDSETIKVKLNNVTNIIRHSDGYEINTGSPHFIKEVDTDLNLIDVNKEGRIIRNQERFAEKGINVDFVQKDQKGKISIRTYERGVEAETLSCGTGSVASAIYSIINQEDGNYAVGVHTLGGMLTVELQKQDNVFTNIWLCGKAIEVFEGNIKINL